MKTYCAIFEQAEDGINVEFPDLPGCLTCGNTIEDAFENAVDAAEMYLEYAGDNWVPTKALTFSEAQEQCPGKTIFLVPVADPAIEYQKYEFCMDVECERFVNEKCKAKTDLNCIYAAKEFHHWLKENGFEIVKAAKEE